MRTFSKTFIVIIIPVFIAFFLTYLFVKRTIDGHLRDYAFSEAKIRFEMVAADFSYTHPDYNKLFNKYHRIYLNTGVAVVVAGEDGKVVFDSTGRFKKGEKLKDLSFSRRGDGGNSISYTGRLPNGYIMSVSFPLNGIREMEKGFEDGVYLVFIVTFFVALGASVLTAGMFSLSLRRLRKVVEVVRSGGEMQLPHFKERNLAKVASLIYSIYRTMRSKQREIEMEKEKLNHILEFMEEGVVLLNSDNTLAHCNNSFKRMFDIEIKPGENILSSIKNPDLLGAVFDVLKSRESRILKIGGRMYKVYFKDIGEYTLLVFDDVEDKMQYEYFKSELVGNISHELKTPIAMLSAYAETLLMYENLDDKTKSMLLKKLYEGSMRLSELVNDITELHRLENMSISDVVEETDLEEVKDELEFMYKNSGKKVHINFASGRVRILKEHLMSVLTNLVSNAVKYSGGDSVYVNIVRQDEGVVVFVDDEGPLIPDEERERIFERFYTRSKSRNRQISGTGLGLSIVKHIAMLYNGYVKLTKSPDGGNRFVVYFRVRWEGYPEKPSA